MLLAWGAMAAFGTSVTLPLRIDCGGKATGTFAADAFFTGGVPFLTPLPINTTGVTNPAPLAVYQSNRANGPTYTFTLTPKTACTVRLHLADIRGYAAGQSPLSVSINGASVLSNYDIVSAAGASYKAVALAFNATSDATGKITLTYSSSALGVGVCGIEILAGSMTPLTAPTGLAASPASTKVTLTWNAVTGATGYNVLRSASSTGPFVRVNTSTITATTYTDTGLTNHQTYYYEVLAVNSLGEGPACSPLSTVPGGTTLPLQVNCGGPAVGTFRADEGFTGGTVYLSPFTIDTSSVTNPPPATVYQSLRPVRRSTTLYCHLTSRTPYASISLTSGRIFLGSLQ